MLNGMTINVFPWLEPIDKAVGDQQLGEGG